MEWSHIRERRSEVPTSSWCSIVGAPRCGTTSLARYLGGHPDVCAANVKEPHYFSRRDYKGVSEAETERSIREEYVERFFREHVPGTMLLDGSVSYLYAPERLMPALRTWPDAKFIIAIRNPLEMLPSLHQRHFCNGDENVADFERAWSLVGERRSGKRIPRTCIDPRLLDYEEIGRLGKYVRQFFDVVGRERCFVSVFDDLVADPAFHYSQILAFLSLPQDRRDDFYAFRASTGIRSPLLQRLLKRPPVARQLLSSEAALRREGIAMQNGRRARAGMPSLKALRKQLLKWNRTSPPERRLSPALTAAIRDALAGDVADLSALLHRDLGHWLASGSESRTAP
jgi:hypothetical protein